MGKQLKRLKSFFAWFLAFAVVFETFGWYSDVNAFDPGQYRVDSVTIFKIYDANRNLTQRKVLIQGKYLTDAKVGIVTSTGYQLLTNRSVNSYGVLQFDINKDQLGISIDIEGFTIPINEGEMPTLSGISRTVKMGVDDLVINGSNLTNVSSAAISAGYEHDGAYTAMSEATFTDNFTVTVPKPSGALGLQNVIFQKTDVVSNQTFNTQNQNVNISVNVKYTYIDQFRFIKDINAPGLEMHPNRGQKGETVFFEAPKGNLDSYDVFFLKAIDGTDPYTNLNKGTNKTFQADINGKSILSVQVPNLPIGDYYVVLTNPISDGNDPMKEVFQEKVVGTAPDYERYTIIDASVKSKIISLQPSTGPDSGSKTTISGQFLISMNIPEYTTTSTAVSSVISTQDPASNPISQEINITYAPGLYKGIPVNNVTRKIKAIIGGNATFLKNAGGTAYDVTYNKDIDKIAVQTPQITDAETNPIKDVVVETETTFTKADGSGEIVIKERAVLTKGYTFIPSKITPSINDATPNKFEVEQDGNGNFQTMQDIMIAIHGSNFMITKFRDEVQNTEITRYPIIKFGSDVGLNKNTKVNAGDPVSNPGLDVRVYDSSGRQLDGTQGNEIGTKIIVTIPKGTTMSAIGKFDLMVSNPVRNSENSGLDAVKSDYIEFVESDSNEKPVISQVSPSTATVDGGEQITVDGSNFLEGVKVFIDGEEVKSIVRQGDSKKITFVCPAGHEGDTLLEVMNPKGGMDVWPFSYVKTYTNPKIIDFSPKSGKTGTLVVVTGDNFLKPDPTAGASSINKLIGTRILMGGADINQYNINSTTKKVELIEYTSPAAQLISISTGPAIKLADYYDAVMLQDSSGKLYTIELDTNGTPVIFDGISSKYTIELDSSGTNIVANKQNGGTYPVVVGKDAENGDTYTFNGITLKVETLYKIDGNGVIVGKKAKVVDIKHIYFDVPSLPGNGYYDVTVLNPDTKKDSRVGTQGFLYFNQPITKPKITDISPSEGSVDGGYTILLRGTEFENNGTTKTRVYINGVEADSKDVVIGVDSKTISLKVPPYPGDLRKDKNTNRCSVPVVVVNPDGGSDSLENGFTYVIPSSSPQISKILPMSGSASGGNVVLITGTDFRFFEPFVDLDKDQTWDSDESYNDLNGNGSYDGETETFADSQNYASPILPKVYFGSNQARISEFGRGYLKVVVPSGAAGSTQVYVVNNDAGMSNKVSYTYVSSKPVITKIIPAQGKKQGKDKIEISGSGFENSSIEVYEPDLDALGNNIVTTLPGMPLVRFGTISNRKIAWQDENSGRIDSKVATVNIEGNLTIDYNGTAKTLKLTLVDKSTYQATITGYDNSVKYIPISLLKNSEGVSYTGYELIRVEVDGTEGRLYIDRGYSPLTQYISSGQMIVNTPSYYTVGTVDVTVINPDGGTALSKFEYKSPDSSPSIISITKEDRLPVDGTVNGKPAKIIKINIKGGSRINIIGDDFRDNARIAISNIFEIAPDKINYSLPTRLSFEMPQIPDSAVGKFNRVIVINEDGGQTASDELSPPIYIEFTKGETAPAITNVSPDKGPSSGGTIVKLEGTDFREKIEGFDPRIIVYFGDARVRDEDIKVADYKTIYVTSPQHAAGIVKIRVENPDGVVSSSTVTYTYISCPKITAVVDPTDSSENTRISTISVLGGQELKLKGSGFVDGARVVFNPVIKKADSGAVGETINIMGQSYILVSGTNGTNVKIIDGETLTVTAPQSKIGTYGVIVINSDGGASDVYNDITYALPEVSAPTDVKAQLVYGRYIKITWKAVDKASSYEVYAVVDNKTEFVSSTELNSFMYSDIVPKTEYKFIIKAIGDFGLSKPSSPSNTVDTGDDAGIPDEDSGLNDNTIITRSGNKALVTIGKKQLNSTAVTIDLTKGELAGSSDAIVSIPASVVTSYNAKDIIIKGKDFTLKINPYAFKTSVMVANSSRKDAGVRFTVSRYGGSSDMAKAFGTVLSTQYVLDASSFIGKDSKAMEYLNSSIEITLDYDVNKADMRNSKDIDIDRYSVSENKWVTLPGSMSAGSAAYVSTNRLGRFAVVGRRG